MHPEPPHRLGYAEHAMACGSFFPFCERPGVGEPGDTLVSEGR
jgi:hypothetical protein